MVSFDLASNSEIGNGQDNTDTATFFANYRPPAVWQVGGFHDVCVHAHVKTLCARVCGFDWLRKVERLSDVLVKR